MSTKLAKTRDNVKVSHLEVTIFDEYCKTELQPLKSLLKHKYNRLRKLQAENPNDLTKHEDLTGQEVTAMYQAAVALEGLRDVYKEHYFQLWEEKQRLEYELASTQNELARARDLAAQAMIGEKLYLNLLTQKSA